MILDRIDNLKFYGVFDKKLAAIVEFLKTHPTLSDGHYELDMGIYVNVGSGTVRDSGDFEVHRRYADLQWVIEGSEVIEWASLSVMRSSTEYNEAGDYQLFSDAAGETVALKLTPGYFAIFYPQDGHKPSLRLNHDVSRKAIFKIPL